MSNDTAGVLNNLLGAVIAFFDAHHRLDREAISTALVDLSYAFMYVRLADGSESALQSAADHIAERLVTGVPA